MRIIRFLKALIKYMRCGRRVQIDEYIRRLIVCKDCKNFNNAKWSCEKCGCYLTKKAKMNTEKCPDDKW